MLDTTSTLDGQADEFFLDTPEVRAFVADVRRTLAEHADVLAGLVALRSRFAALLANQAWLPDAFAAPYAASGMGGGIATWLIFRAADRSLSLFSLVVPPGAATPIHDHLAWGFVGLYRGEQAETVYQRTDAAEPSISIHLLANDTGCVLRHAFDPDRAQVRPFRSGYSNVACAADDR